MKTYTEETYHVFNKSISNYKIFNSDVEYRRMENLLRYYQYGTLSYSFSFFSNTKLIKQVGFIKALSILVEGRRKTVQLISRCIMPTHIHLVLKQLVENGIPTFMNNILNGYTHYFNLKHNRKGPLWVGKSKKTHIQTDDELLHVTRYVHINPTTAYLVEKPEDWDYSSYKEYIHHGTDKICNPICNFEEFMNIIEPKQYKKFVDDRIDYQKQLAKIKKFIIE
jgi:putative transposase